MAQTPMFAGDCTVHPRLTKAGGEWPWRTFLTSPAGSHAPTPHCPGRWCGRQPPLRAPGLFDHDLMASGVDTDGKRRVSAGAGMRQDEDLAAERLSVPVGGRDGPHRERREARGERIVLPLPEDVHQCL